MKTFKTEPKLVKIKDTNRIMIKMLFFYKYEKEDMIKDIMLDRILKTCNNKYRTPGEFETKKEDLFILNLSVESEHYVDTAVKVVTISLPKEGIIDEFNIEESLKFVYETIYNPYVKNNEFDNEHFNWEKDFIIDREKNYPNNIYDYIDEKINNMINEIEDTFITHDEYMKFIQEQTPKTIYEHYKKTILDNNFITYIYGNVDEKVKEAFNKYFKPKEKELKVEMKYHKFLKLTDYKEIEKKTKYNQSALNLLYQIKDFKFEERVFLDMLYFFLSARENDLIFQNLRVKNNLIYNASVLRSKVYGYLGITAYLDKEDIEKAQKIIEDTLKDIQDENKFNTYKERLVRAFEYDILADEDDDYKEIKEMIMKALKSDYNLKEKFEVIKKITADDMKKFIDRLVLTRKLTIIGDTNE